MIYADSKELYADFLLSDFWIGLSRKKRNQVRRCEQCGSDNRLQAHHLRYPENWFDTRLEDLKVLCRSCHEKEHGIIQIAKTAKDEIWRQYNRKLTPVVFFGRRKKKHKNHKRFRRIWKTRNSRTGNFLLQRDGRLVYQPRI